MNHKKGDFFKCIIYYIGIFTSFFSLDSAIYMTSTKPKFKEFVGIIFRPRNKMTFSFFYKDNSFQRKKNGYLDCFSLFSHQKFLFFDTFLNSDFKCKCMKFITIIAFYRRKLNGFSSFSLKL